MFRQCLYASAEQTNLSHPPFRHAFQKNLNGMTLKSGRKDCYESFAKVFSLEPATIAEETQSGTLSRRPFWMT